MYETNVYTYNTVRIEAHYPTIIIVYFYFPLSIEFNSWQFCALFCSVFHHLQHIAYAFFRVLLHVSDVCGVQCVMCHKDCLS